MSRSVQRRPIALERPNAAKGLSKIGFDYCGISIRFCLRCGGFLYADDIAANGRHLARSVSNDDMRVLTELGLIEARDEGPVLTRAGAAVLEP